jgi:hypothetical protein
MSYWLVGLADDQGNPTALTHLETSIGRIALVYTDKEKADEAATYTQHFVARPDQQVAMLEVKGSRSELLTILQGGAGLKFDTNLKFLIEDEGDSVFDQAFRYILEQNRTVQPERSSEPRTRWHV